LVGDGVFCTSAAALAWRYSASLEAWMLTPVEGTAAAGIAPDWKAKNLRFFRALFDDSGGRHLRLRESGLAAVALVSAIAPRRMLPLPRRECRSRMCLGMCDASPCRFSRSFAEARPHGKHTPAAAVLSSSPRSSCNTRSRGRPACTGCSPGALHSLDTTGRCALERDRSARRQSACQLRCSVT
jgi:hypothetical protein